MRPFSLIRMGRRAIRGQESVEATGQTKGPLAFIIRAAISDTDECIIWPWAEQQGGYGTLTLDRKTWSAHGLVTALRFGKKPSKAHQAGHVEHTKCGNRACCNPNHLTGWLTPAENAAMKKADGTNRQALTREQVAAIKRDSRLTRELAAAYGVSEATIRNAKLGKYGRLRRRFGEAIRRISIR